MYAGHLGFAIGAASFRRTIPLWLLLFAAQLPDWLDAGMCVVNANRGPNGLYTHGIPTVAACAVVLALLYALRARDTVGGLIVAVTVVSHYALDYLTGIKPTWPGGPVIGLRLYERPLIDFTLEAATILLGWWLYRRTLPRDHRNERRCLRDITGTLCRSGRGWGRVIPPYRGASEMLTSIPVISPIEITLGSPEPRMLPHAPLTEAGPEDVLPVAAATAMATEPDYTVETLGQPLSGERQDALTALGDIERVVKVIAYPEADWWRARLPLIREVLERGSR